MAKGNRAIRGGGRPHARSARVLLGYRRSRLHPAHRRPDLASFSETMMKRLLNLPGVSQVKTNIADPGQESHVLPLEHVTRPARRGRRIGFNESGQGRLTEAPAGRWSWHRPAGLRFGQALPCPAPTAHQAPMRCRRHAPRGAPLPARTIPDEAGGLHSTTADPAATGLLPWAVQRGCERRHDRKWRLTRPVGAPDPCRCTFLIWIKRPLNNCSLICHRLHWDPGCRPAYPLGVEIPRACRIDSSSWRTMT